MSDTIDRFRKALNFIKYSRGIDSDKEIARALKVTPSYLSQVLSGKRQLTPQLLQAFERRFGIHVNDPLSYTDLSEGGMDGFTPQTFAEMFSKMRNMLVQRDTVIRSQQDIIIALMKEREILMDLIYQEEQNIIDNQK